MRRRILSAATTCVLALFLVAGMACDSGTPVIPATPTMNPRPTIEAMVTATVMAYRAQPPGDTFTASGNEVGLTVSDMEYRTSFSAITQAAPGTKFVLAWVRVTNKGVSTQLGVSHDDFTLIACDGEQARFNDPTILGVQGALPSFTPLEEGAYTEGWLVFYTRARYAPCRLAWHWAADKPSLSVWFAPQLP